MSSIEDRLHIKWNGWFYATNDKGDLFRAPVDNPVEVSEVIDGNPAAVAEIQARLADADKADQDERLSAGHRFGAFDAWVIASES